MAVIYLLAFCTPNPTPGAMAIDYHRADLKSPRRLGPNMERRNPLVLGCIAIACGGMMVLASLEEAPEYLEVGPGEVDGLAPGTLVIVEGEVGPEGTMDNGAFGTLVLVGGTGRAVVFLRFPPPRLAPGDRVRVAGEVDLYQGRMEVVVDAPSDLTVLEGGVSPRVRLAELMSDPWSFRDLEPLVDAVVKEPPTPSPGSGERWCVVADPDGTGSTAVAMLPPDADLGDWDSGAELELRVLVRYDPTRGLVYLEVLHWANAG